jgi:hypothetical protein
MFDYRDIINRAELSDVSKRLYIYNLEMLEKKMGKGINYILTHPNEVVGFINRTYDELQTRKAFVVACSSLFKHDNTLQCRIPRSHEKWVQHTLRANKEVSDRYKMGMATEKQEASYIAWEEVMRKLGELEYGSVQHLLLAMYVLEPPKRQDYGALKVYIEGRGEVRDVGNYLVLRSGKKALLVMNEYKTAKKYDKKEFELSVELTKLVNHSIRTRPREYLFVNREGRAFSKESFAKFTGRVFKGIFGGRNVTVNTLRHSIIKYTLEHQNKHSDRERLSDRMCHSVGMQSAYHYELTR